MSLSDFLRDLLDDKTKARDWEETERRVREMADASSERRLHSLVSAAREMLPLLVPREPPPVVNVFIEAVDDRGAPRWLGACRSIAAREHVIELVSSLRYTKGRVIVFADLTRVRVRHMFKGTDALHDWGGDGVPIGTFEELLPGVRLRILLERL